MPTNHDLALSQLFCEHHPSDAASILVRMPAEYATGFVSSLSPEQAMELIRHMPTAYATQLLSYLESGFSAQLLARADFSTASRLLRPLPERQRELLMAKMDAPNFAQLSRVLNYPPGSVGNLVEIPVLTALGDWNVKHTRQELKKISQQAISDFPVVDDEHRFLGTVTLHALLTHRDTQRLDEFCQGKELALPAHATIVSILRHPLWENNQSIAVIDRDRILIGLLHRTELNSYISTASQISPQDLLAPVMAVAELYWAVSSSALAMLSSKATNNDG